MLHYSGQSSHLVGHDGSGVSETCGHALETREFSHIGRPAKPFFILEVCGPQRSTRYVEEPEPSQVRRRGLEPRGTW
jgi:hypothetical protein